MKDSRQRFSATAGTYDRYRPRYPDALAAWIAATTGAGPGARVVDLGCGTGISSRYLAAHGYVVHGVEPNEEMRAAAVAAGGAPTYGPGEATATGLPDASADLCTAAQAFHWFDLQPTLAELRRILVPGGWSCAFWNLREGGAFNDAYEQLLLDRSSEYRSDASDPRVDVAAALEGARKVEIDWEERVPVDFVVGRARSSSYVAHGVADIPAFEERLRAIHARHADAEGRVRWVLKTVAIAWPRPA